MDKILLEILTALQGNNSAILVGGQCLLVWAFHYESLGEKNLQVATKDIDFLGNKETVKLIEKLLGQRASIPSMDHATPEVGVLKVPGGSGQVLTIDVLATIAGLSGAEVEKYSATIQIGGVKAKVLNPVGMLKSRVANVIVLRRTGEHSLRQLRATVRIVNRFITSLLDFGYKYARKEIDDVLYVAGHREGIEIYKKFGIDILESIPMSHKNYAEGFVNRHLPACIAKIERKRKS